MSDTKKDHEPLEKFGDIQSPYERDRFHRRHLPPMDRHRQYNETEEIEERRKADERFRIKKTQ